MPELHRRPRRLKIVRHLAPEDRVTAHCLCGRVVRISVTKIVRRFPPKADFADVASSLLCEGTKKKPGCGRRAPSLRCLHDDRVSWLYVTSEVCPAPGPAGNEPGASG